MILLLIMQYIGIILMDQLLVMDMIYTWQINVDLVLIVAVIKVLITLETQIL